MEVLYEDNHIIIVNKEVGEIVQGDKTGDRPLCDIVAAYLKEKYSKPGNVFVGVVHRLDRPVAGVVVFAKTSKALARMNELFRVGKVSKTYWALSRNRPPRESDRLVNYITTVEKTNKSTAWQAPRPGAKEAVLTYTYRGASDRYHLLEVNLETGRKHQIRVQLSAIGCPVKGDIKYGDRRTNPDGGISLLARRICFVHPVSKEVIDVTAPLPDEPLWRAFEGIEPGIVKEKVL